jgi:amino acid adenylation domain-containing protein
MLWQRCSKGIQLTYRELNRRANRLAHFLVDYGIGADDVVALLDERGLDLLTAIVAVLKAGAAYLPLDPHHPEERIAQVLQQSGCRLILTAKRCAPLLWNATPSLNGHAPDVFLIEELLARHEPETNLPVRCGPDNLAYVIYTSGTTGTPKGVMIEHRGMLNHLFAMIDNLQITASDRMAQTASQCFDISVWQFLVNLIVGGSVHIFGDEVARDPAQLLDALERDGITILEPVPSLLQAMVDDALYRKEARPQTRGVALAASNGRTIAAGVVPSVVQLVQKHSDAERIWSGGVSDDMTLHVIDKPPAADVLHMPIGHPIENSQVYVLDSAMKLVPVGVAGELYIGGTQVGRGYLNRPELTAEKFLPDPFSGDSGARLYKSGDKVRWMPTGVLEFLGRFDHQVKVRGFRIELGDIEAALGQHAAVRECAVLAREDSPGVQRLVGYVVVRREHSLSVAELRAFLKRKLPPYMVPSAFVMLDSMPLTGSGKIDRNALPVPDLESSEIDKGDAAPQNTQQETLLQIWKGSAVGEQHRRARQFLRIGRRFDPRHSSDCSRESGGPWPHTETVVRIPDDCRTCGRVRKGDGGSG